MDFVVLGALEVVDDGRSLPLGGPKQRALLAILLLNANETVSRDRLIDGIWGEQPPANPAQALDTYVSRLRKLLGPERVARRGGGYSLRVDSGELDLTCFEELAAAGKFRDALALWRGPALDDLLFEPFAATEATRLEARRLVVLEERIDADLASGRAAELVPELEQLVRDHPLRERLVGELMVALYRAGRQSAALEAYRRTKRALSEELGLEPAPQLQDLERRILAHDPVLEVAPADKQTTSVHRGTSWARLGAAGAVALLAAGVVAAVVTLRSGGSSSAKPFETTSSSLVSVDLDSRRASRSSILPHPPAALVQGFGSLWVADPTGEQVLRIDRRTGKTIDRIAVQAQPSALVVGGGAVWVASAVGGLVTRIDPLTDRPTQTRRLGGANPSALVFARGSLWVADLTDHSLVRIDPRSGSAEQSVHLDLPPSGLAAGAGRLWAIGYNAGAVDEIDLDGGQVVARHVVGTGPSAILVASGSVWVTNSLDGTLTRIDVSTGKTRSTVPIGNGPAALAAAGSSIWVASEHSGTVSEVDGRNGEVRTTLSPGGRPAALAVFGSELWVGAGPSANPHRGGTLTLSGVTPPNSLDPAFLYTGSLQPTQLPHLVYDTLVTFDNAPGSRGLRLVPDLAQGLPEPTDRGTTYVFRVRRGIRYSTGRYVRASDFRRAFERLFRGGSPSTGFYAQIVGARRCGLAPVGCDLSRGIVTNDAAGTVIFHLSEPDPDFLFKLTEYAFGAPVPPGTPDRDLFQLPPPGTGPYRFVAGTWDPLRLERNPYFREWSHAAQPDGNPDTIVWRFPRTHDAEIRDIENGKADWTLDFVPVAQLHEIVRTHPAQLHVNPAFIVEYIPLNPNLPPFDDVKVRQALNYAVDRREIARLYGGPIVATPLCQPLPPGMPGFVRYCPYTARADARGEYHGPDLARARALVAASKRRGAHVTVWGASHSIAIPPALPGYIASVLGRLGFDVDLRIVPLNSITSAQRESFQLSVDGDWLADFPTAASFLPLFFGCQGAHNHGYYCDPHLDRLMEQATAADSEDAQRAARFWTTADHSVTDGALWVPMVNINEVDFVSSRLGNYVFNPVYGFLAAQAWVR